MSDAPFRVLVCGGRHYDNALEVERALNYTLARCGTLLIIHGGATGADRLAAAWAKRLGFQQREFRAEWQRYRRGAGPRRNQQMLDEGKPQLVLAFPGGRGTQDMVRRASDARIPVQFWDDSSHDAARAALRQEEPRE